MLKTEGSQLPGGIQDSWQSFCREGLRPRYVTLVAWAELRARGICLEITCAGNAGPTRG